MHPDEDEDFALPDDADTDGVVYPADVQPPEEMLAEPPPQAVSAPINIVEERPKMAEPPLLVEEFARKYYEQQNEQPKEYIPPPMTERQVSSREAEMRAGAARVKHFEDQKKLRPPPVRDPHEGTTTPVFRPGDYVPTHPALTKLAQSGG